MAIFEQYLHTLIPGTPTFAPTPEQVIHFADGLSALGAEPLNHRLILIRPSGRVRTAEYVHSRIL